MPTTARTVVAVISRPPARWRGSTSRLTAVGPLAIGESACAHESRHLTDGRPDIHARDSLATTCGKPATPPGLQSPPVLDPVRSPCTVPFLLAATTVRTHDATVFTWICTSLAPQGALRRHLHSVHVPPKIMERTRGGVAEIVAHPTFIATSDLNSLPCAVSKHWCEAEESHHGESGGTRNFLEFPNKKKRTRTNSKPLFGCLGRERCGMLESHVLEVRASPCYRFLPCFHPLPPNKYSP
jgi:hypothetical protein